MSGTTLALDTILSATFHFATKWSSNLQSNKARDLLRYVVCRLYDEGRGQMMNAQLTLAQTTLAQKLNMSRQWVGELVSRLDREGWITHESPTLPDGTNGSTIFRAGRMLKRLIVMLLKSKQRKSPIKSPAKDRWHFSPLKREKKILELLQKENEPPTPAMIEKMPILKTWMERGKTQ